ncbi:hypothetical protein BCR34DRAFT_620202 [Clohesyomyces aquaticus]|uniref:DUF2231 domain-containing protein n=1 Tax=Clohesyomyces aquaticus TaxID=1231657 RepID=A0A1Y1Y8K1_9PLEO|nr:hypothetical protein BCR34DRAFT_620202 [Clohesyomyces aquaticus]
MKFRYASGPVQLTSSSNPAHPATVHFPIAFITLTGALDALYVASSHPSTAGLVASTLKTLDMQLSPAMLPQLSYYTTVLALITALPATVSGVMELMPLIQRDGFSTPKAQTGALHAALNDISLLALVYNWWTRRSAVGFEPSSTNVAISALLNVPATLFAAYLGGALVYQYGMGMGRGASKSKKAQ